MNYYDAVEAGKRIKTMRVAKGYTQEQLSEILGINEDSLGRIERGTRSCSIDLFVMLTQIFDVSLDYLIMGTPQSVAINSEKLDAAIKLLADIRADQQHNL